MKHFIGQLITWVLFTGATLVGAGLSHTVFNTGISLPFIFGFSLGMAFMQGWNYEMNNKGKDQ